MEPDEEIKNSFWENLEKYQECLKGENIYKGKDRPIPSPTYVPIYDKKYRIYTSHNGEKYRVCEYRKNYRVCDDEWDSLEGSIIGFKTKDGEYVNSYVLKSQLSDFKKDELAVIDDVKQSGHNNKVVLIREIDRDDGNILVSSKTQQFLVHPKNLYPLNNQIKTYIDNFENNLNLFRKPFKQGTLVKIGENYPIKEIVGKLGIIQNIDIDNLPDDFSQNDIDNIITEDYKSKLLKRHLYYKIDLYNKYTGEIENIPIKDNNVVYNNIIMLNHVMDLTTEYDKSQFLVYHHDDIEIINDKTYINIVINNMIEKIIDHVSELKIYGMGDEMPCLNEILLTLYHIYGYKYLYYICDTESFKKDYFKEEINKGIKIYNLYIDIFDTIVTQLKINTNKHVKTILWKYMLEDCNTTVVNMILSDETSDYTNNRKQKYKNFIQKKIPVEAIKRKTDDVIDGYILPKRHCIQKYLGKRDESQGDDYDNPIKRQKKKS